jgi:hypothetical protein
MVTGGGVTIPNNVTGATVGALVATVVVWLLTLIPGLQHMPDDVRQAIFSLIIVATTALGGWIEHRSRSKTS